MLWLLTPWWGRRDLLFVRCHLRALLLVLATVLAGVIVSPGAAFGGRLVGVIWPIPAPQVAEYAAVLSGMAIVLWMTGSLVRRQAALFAGGGLAIVLLSHTRTALVALVAGVFCAASTLFFSRRRARRTLTIFLLVVPLALVALAPIALSWFARRAGHQRARRSHRPEEGLGGPDRVAAIGVRQVVRERPFRQVVRGAFHRQHLARGLPGAGIGG